MVPTPTLYLGARTIYAAAMALALKRSQLRTTHTSFVAGLIRALDVPDAERAWLSGDNILSDVMRYPGDVIAGRTTPNRFELLVKMIGISSTAGLRHCIG